MNVLHHMPGVAYQPLRGLLRNLERQRIMEMFPNSSMYIGMQTSPLWTAPGRTLRYCTYHGYLNAELYDVIS